MFYEQVAMTNFKKLGNYMVLLPKTDDHVTHVTSKNVGGNFIITVLYTCTSLSTHFPLQGFIRDVFRYSNLSPV